MTHNALFIGWDRPVPGRERQTLEHFQEFLTYLGRQQQSGNITSFTPVMIHAHGGDLNGFVLIQGEPNGLNKMTSEDAFNDHFARSTAHMLRVGVLPAYVGKEMEKKMQRYAKFV